MSHVCEEKPIVPPKKENKDNQIKRCPFCSSINVTTDSHLSYWVRCDCCGASGPIRNTMQVAINEWNEISRLVHSRN